MCAKREGEGENLVFFSGGEDDDDDLLEVEQIRWAAGSPVALSPLDPPRSSRRGEKGIFRMTPEINLAISLGKAGMRRRGGEERGGYCVLFAADTPPPPLSPPSPAFAFATRETAATPLTM